MKQWLFRLGTVLALVFVALTFINASWIAPSPRGYIKLIADGGVAQQPLDRSAKDCAAPRIEPPLHASLADTVPAIVQSDRYGAQMVAVDVVAAKDGLALFPDAQLDCRTDGQGDPRTKTVAELKALDAGHGYAEGPRFPFRGKGLGLIPTLPEAVQAAGTKALLYRITGTQSADADALAAALKAAGRDVTAAGDGFTGAPAPVARIRQLYPKAWAWSPQAAGACSSDYRLMGWLGMTPDSCRGGTIVIPLDGQWMYAGWPNRLIARMEAVGARVIVAGPGTREGGMPAGIDLPEQLGEIPNTFNGYVWVDDIWTVGPALRPAIKRRSQFEEEHLAAVLEARRKRRE